MLYHARRSALAVSALTVSTLALCTATAAHAQDAASPSKEAAGNADDDYHDTIVVTAQGIGRIDFLAGTTVVGGTDLQRSLDGQIGEVLEGLPGVTASGFAPGASRPILRGFSGDRVRVLIDGIGAIDASNTSADHAVSLDPLTAQRIEVLRGPATLLYGSSAIGGAVNVIDKRIPLKVPEEPLHLDALASIDSAANAREAGASVDLPLGGNFVIHADGSWRETDDLHVAGRLLSDDLRAEVLAEAAEDEAEDPVHAAELREMANARDVLPNSSTRTKSAGLGAAWIGDRANFGVSVSLYDTLYGVPTGPGVEHAHGEEGEGEEAAEEEGPVSIDLQQKRADLRAGLRFDGGPFAEINTRWGVSDYEHVELEGDEVGTRFLVDGVEGRVELVQRERGTWSGTLGGQFFRRDLEAIGNEAFVPANHTEQYGLFALQEVGLSFANLEFAGRFEHGKADAPGVSLHRTFDAWSGALGLYRESDSGLRYGVNVSRTARIPTSEELFANGPHAATQQFEIGDPDLKLETALGGEVYLRGRVGPVDLSLTGYASWFDDFIYLSPTGGEEDGLPIYRQQQQDATYKGFEAEATLPLGNAGGFDLSTKLQGSYTRATLGDGSPVPQIPPLSLGGALIAASDRIEGRISLDWNAAQNRTAAFESETDGFTMVDAALTWKPMRGNENLTVIAAVENLFDAEGRRHASVTKDFVPLAGRNFKLSARLSL
ncbi:TonB-dependent receptor [Croceicoccus naphthovorans]|uniref:TonB-dependent receptor n=1 Tax=Croceicoccus naphthovorans TaxID=1348774 RepID=A0A0G3XFC1_9SPHN|nr:TonB-dependent receptor [Croceicoccus naphthovorans]AKM09043.1 TonB-dependent receptor [Croceicoccus naphthovorans]MBB3991459.1 iron complex outermembrane receptor protein [Croceicoccus naphthovorans]